MLELNVSILGSCLSLSKTIWYGGRLSGCSKYQSILYHLWWGLVWELLEVQGYAIHTKSQPQTTKKSNLPRSQLDILQLENRHSFQVKLVCKLIPAPNYMYIFISNCYHKTKQNKKNLINYVWLSLFAQKLQTNCSDIDLLDRKPQTVLQVGRLSSLQVLLPVTRQSSKL